jgi:outer membrane protein assembly factor BamA
VKTAIPILALLILAADARADGRDAHRIVGNERIDTEDLEEVARRYLRRFRRDPEEMAYAEDAAFEMRRLYLKEGYPLCEVKVEPLEDRPGAEIQIREGPRAFLDDVSVEGSRVIEPDGLASMVDAPRTWFLGPMLVDKRSLKASRDKMEKAYRQLGYLKAEVMGPDFVPPLESAEDGAEEIEVDVRYVVNEGPLARLAWVNVIGPREPLVEEVRERAERFVGLPYSPYRPYDLQALAGEFCRVRGFPFAEVSVSEVLEETEDGIDAGVTLTLRPGRRTRARRIVVRGNYRTQEEAVRRELEFHPGDVLGVRLVQDSKRNLLRTSLFRQAFIEIEKPEDLDEASDERWTDADVEVRVKENDFRRREFSIGWGAWELLRGSVAVTWLNLGGMGRSVRAEVGGSLKGWRAGVTPGSSGPASAGPSRPRSSRRSAPTSRSSDRRAPSPSRSASPTTSSAPSDTATGARTSPR